MFKKIKSFFNSKNEEAKPKPKAILEKETNVVSNETRYLLKYDLRYTMGLGEFYDKMRIFDNEKDAKLAFQRLKENNFQQKKIEVIDSL